MAAYAPRWKRWTAAWEGSSRLRDAGRLEHTLLLFLSDNGGCAELLREDGSHGPRPLTRDGRPITVGNREGLPPPPGHLHELRPALGQQPPTPPSGATSTGCTRGASPPLIAHWPAGPLRGHGGLQPQRGAPDRRPAHHPGRHRHALPRAARRAPGAALRRRGEPPPAAGTGPLVAAPGPGVLGARGEPRRAPAGAARAGEVEAGLPAPGPRSCTTWADRTELRRPRRAQPERARSMAAVWEDQRARCRCSREEIRPRRPQLWGRTPVTERPNIILIITDQQRYDTIGALGFPTPARTSTACSGRGWPSPAASRRLLRPVPGQPLLRLLPPHRGRDAQRRPAHLLGGGPGPRRLPLRQRGQDAHLPFEASAASTSASWWENRPLPEGRYFDRWDSFQARAAETRARAVPPASWTTPSAWAPSPGDLSGGPRAPALGRLRGARAGGWRKPTRPPSCKSASPARTCCTTPCRGTSTTTRASSCPCRRSRRRRSISGAPAHDARAQHRGRPRLDPVVARPVPGAVAPTVDALPGQRDHDRRAGGGLAGRPGRGATSKTPWSSSPQTTATAWATTGRSRSGRCTTASPASRSWSGRPTASAGAGRRRGCGSRWTAPALLELAGVPVPESWRPSPWGPPCGEI